MAAGGGRFDTHRTLLAAYNGADVSGLYKIGMARSADHGATWTKDAANPVLTAGSGWESTYVHNPMLLHDGTQYVMYYTGWNGTLYKVGRATSSDGVTWIRYGSNPVISVGGSGAPDQIGVYGASVLYLPTRSRPWLCWYTGVPTGATASNPTGDTVCFADSADGLSWTKYGAVLSAGSVGAFDDSAALASGAFYDDITGTFHIYYGGFRASTGFIHGGHATCTDPTGAYTKTGVLTGWSGDISVGGLTFRSNAVRSVLQDGGFGRLGFVTVWNDGTGKEASVCVAMSDFVTFAAPSGLMFALSGGAWDSVSAENVTAVLQV